MSNILSTILITKLAPDDAPGMRQYFIDEPSILKVFTDEGELEDAWDELEEVLGEYGGFVVMDRVAFRPHLLFSKQVTNTDAGEPAIVLTFFNQFVYRQIYASEKDRDEDYQVLEEVIADFFRMNPEYIQNNTKQ